MISLFSGGGGFGIRHRDKRFKTRVAIEWERYACDTLLRAKDARVPMGDGHFYLDDAAVIRGDIREISSAQILETARLGVGEAALVIGGPPCDILGRGPAQGNPA